MVAVTQEFLVIDFGGDSIGVFGVGRLPAGTVVSGDARRLRVVGGSPVRPPRDRLTSQQWGHWLQELRDAGYLIEEGDFWR